MNVLTLGWIAVVTLGALLSPLLLVWGGYCLTRPSRRAEGASILGSGALAAGALLIAGFLTAPPDAPGLLRFQALVIVSGVFAIGAATGKMLHLAASWWRRIEGGFKRAE